MNIKVFLEKLKDNNNSEQDKYHIEAIENRLNKLLEISNMNEISVNDALVQYWHQTKDQDRKQFLLKALELTDDEQFPEVSRQKVKVITHMRNHNNFDQEGKHAMDKALSEIERFKGSEFKLFTTMLKRTMPKGSDQFQKAYSDTIDFFQNQTRNIKVERGLASKKIKENSQVLTM